MYRPGLSYVAAALQICPCLAMYNLELVTYSNSQIWLPGLTLDLPHHDGLVWQSLDGVWSWLLFPDLSWPWLANSTSWIDFRLDFLTGTCLAIWILTEPSYHHQTCSACLAGVLWDWALARDATASASPGVTLGSCLHLLFPGRKCYYALERAQNSLVMALYWGCCAMVAQITVFAR